MIDDSFFDVAAGIYAQDPVCIPEEKTRILEQFGDENPFFKAGKVWIKVLPNFRLVGMIHPDYGTNRAYFGFWETVADFELNQELFDEFENWAKSNGCSEIIGPIEFSTFFTYRVRLNQFDPASVFPREPYNPAYYPEFLEQMGYSIYRDYFTDQLNFDNQSLAADPSFWERINSEFDIHPLTADILRSRADDFLDAVNQIFESKDFYCPSLVANFYPLNLPYLTSLLCPKSSFYATSKSGDFVGFYIMMPNYGPLAAQFGDAIPIGSIDYDQHFQRLKSPVGLIKTVGVVPAHTKSGLIFALSIRSFEAAKPLFPGGIWVALTSAHSRKIVASSAIDQTTRYAVFFKGLS